MQEIPATTFLYTSLVAMTGSFGNINSSNNDTGSRKMENIKITKGQMVEAPEDMKLSGVVAFQLVDFEITYFGSIIKSTHDTKIMNDGRQLVIDGDGFIPCGFEI